MAQAREPRTRRCPACDHRFVVESEDQVFCSGTCAGNPPVTTVIAETMRLAALARYAQTRGQ